MSRESSSSPSSSCSRLASPSPPTCWAHWSGGSFAKFSTFISRSSSARHASSWARSAASEYSPLRRRGAAARRRAIEDAAEHRALALRALAQRGEQPPRLGVRGLGGEQTPAQHADRVAELARPLVRAREAVQRLRVRRLALEHDHHAARASSGQSPSFSAHCARLRRSVARAAATAGAASDVPSPAASAPAPSAGSRLAPDGSCCAPSAASSGRRAGAARAPSGTSAAPARPCPP